MSNRNVLLLLFLYSSARHLPTDDNVPGTDVTMPCMPIYIYISFLKTNKSSQYIFFCTIHLDKTKHIVILIYMT